MRGREWEDLGPGWAAHKRQSGGALVPYSIAPTIGSSGVRLMDEAREASRQRRKSLSGGLPLSPDVQGEAGS